MEECNLCHLYNSILLVWSNFTIKCVKRKRKTICKKCPPGNRAWSSGFNRTYWTDNPCIGHIRFRIQGKNFENVYILLMSPVLFICIWYWDDQFNRYFGHILATFVCQENVEISIWHKRLIRNRKWSERQDPDNFSCFSTQEWCAWELPEIALNNALLSRDLFNVPWPTIMWVYTNCDTAFYISSLHKLTKVEPFWLVVAYTPVGYICMSIN